MSGNKNRCRTYFNNLDIVIRNVRPSPVLIKSSIELALRALGEQFQKTYTLSEIVMYSSFLFVFIIQRYTLHSCLANCLNMFQLNSLSL